MTLTRYIPIPVLYLVWPKVGDNHWWETPTPLIEPKCGVSNNAKADVRWWPKTVDVEDEDGHHKPKSKCWHYNNLQNTTIYNNNLITQTRSNYMTTRRNNTYEIHNEKRLGLPKSGFPLSSETLNFMDEYGSHIGWYICLDLL